MREILYRGKREDYGDWVEGYCVFDFWKKKEATIHMIGGGCCTVDPATLGRYTMFNDKEGTPIFEGDITELELLDGEKRYFEVAFKKVKRTVASHPTFDEPTAKVEIYGVVFLWQGFELFPCVDEHGINDTKKMKVVGNIHDQQED